MRCQAILCTAEAAADSSYCPNHPPVLREIAEQPVLGFRTRFTDGWAYQFGVLWDWIDKRDIDKHFVSLAILYGTVKVMGWSMTFAEANADKAGLEIAAILAAVTAPYMALQAFALKQYFEARPT